MIGTFTHHFFGYLIKRLGLTSFYERDKVISNLNEYVDFGAVVFLDDKIDLFVMRSEIFKVSN